MASDPVNGVDPSGLRNCNREGLDADGQQTIFVAPCPGDGIGGFGDLGGYTGAGGGLVGSGNCDITSSRPMLSTCDAGGGGGAPDIVVTAAKLKKGAKPKNETKQCTTAQKQRFKLGRTLQNVGTAGARTGEAIIVTAAVGGALAGGPLDPPAAAGAVAAASVGGIIGLGSALISSAGALLQFSVDRNYQTLGRNLLGAYTPGKGLAGVVKSETVGAANGAVDRLTGGDNCVNGR